MTVFADAGAAMPLDPRLASAKVVRATFHPAGKMPNYFGLQIAQLAAIPSAMRYERDGIVDLTGE